MGKYTVCTSKNEGAGQLRINRAAINQHLYLREMIHFREMIKSLYFLNTNVDLTWLSLVCVGPVNLQHGSFINYIR